MIDFSTLQGLTIPEGVVTQITDASGNVLWSAVPMVVITLSGTPSSYAYIVVDGKTYDSVDTMPSSLRVPVGTELTVYVKRGSIFINDVDMDLLKIVYPATVDMSIELTLSGTQAGYAYITDPDTITFVAYYTTYVAKCGMTWDEFVTMTNGDTFSIADGTYVGINGTPMHVQYNGNDVLPSDVIVDGATYTVYNSNAGEY